MTTPEARAKAAAKRARAKKRAQVKRDAKMLGLGALLGMVLLSFVALTHQSPTPTTPQPTTATVVHKVYSEPADNWTAEDGSQVPDNFYSQRSGPTQATCNYLHKTLVADPIYGTRCI